MHSTVWYQIHPLLRLQAHSPHIKFILASSQAYPYQTASLHTQSIESSPLHALKQLQIFMILFVSSACFFAVSPMATKSHVTTYPLIRFCKSRKTGGKTRLQLAKASCLALILSSLVPFRAMLSL